MSYGTQTPPQNNTHARAASAYGTQAKHTPNPRETEARVLLKSASMLKDLQDNLDSANAEIIEKTLMYNRQIWMIFYDTAIENKGEGHTNELRSNIVNLANFIFKRHTEILGAPEADKFDALININRELAAGLMGSPEKSN